LRTFGVKSDELIQEHFEQHPDLEKLHLRLVLVDLTDYGIQAREPELHFEVEGEISKD
jgi:hypothetical protein